MAQGDPWVKAADCERAIRITFDPLHSETFTNIREFWIAVARKSRSLSGDALATEMKLSAASTRNSIVMRAAIRLLLRTRFACAPVCVRGT
jgi:hypothetical protein